jgi:hypothetical protein
MSSSRNTSVRSPQCGFFLLRFFDAIDYLLWCGELVVERAEMSFGRAVMLGIRVVSFIASIVLFLKCMHILVYFRNHLRILKR